MMAVFIRGCLQMDLVHFKHKITFSSEDGSEEEEFIRTMMGIAEGEKANIGPESDDVEFERKSKDLVKLYK